MRRLLVSFLRTSTLRPSIRFRPLFPLSCHSRQGSVLLTPDMTQHPTLIRPPDIDKSKSTIENALELVPLTDIGPVSWPGISSLAYIATNLTVLRISSPTRARYGIHPEREASSAGLSSRNVSVQRRAQCPRTSPSTRCTATLSSLVIPTFPCCTTWNKFEMGRALRRGRSRQDRGEGVSSRPL